MKTKDATCTPIEIGRMYGYSQNSNGFTNAVMGKCTKVNEEKVKLPQRFTNVVGVSILII